jgi:hypothetical protein
VNDRATYIYAAIARALDRSRDDLNDPQKNLRTLRLVVRMKKGGMFVDEVLVVPEYLVELEPGEK